MSEDVSKKKIGQLFVIRANSTDDEKQQLSVEKSDQELCNWRNLFFGEKRANKSN